MPEWCPRCGALLPDGLERCPRCGAALKGGSTAGEGDFKASDFFRLSAYSIGVVLVPLLVGIAIGLLCFLVFFSN